LFVLAEKTIFICIKLLYLRTFRGANTYVVIFITGFAFTAGGRAVLAGVAGGVTGLRTVAEKAVIAAGIYSALNLKAFVAFFITGFACTAG